MTIEELKTLRRNVAIAFLRPAIVATTALLLLSCPSAKALSFTPVPEPTPTEEMGCRQLAFDGAIIMALWQRGFPAQTIYQAMYDRRPYFQTAHGREALTALVAVAATSRRHVELTSQEREVRAFGIAVYDVCMAGE